MTTNTDRAALVATVERLGVELADAQADASLLQRLKDADANAKRIAAELRKAQEELAEVIANATEARRDAQYAVFEDITVTESPDEKGGGLLSTKFSIAVTRHVNDGFTSGIRTDTFGGFLSLPDDAYGYLIEKHPERIPASIMALSPGDAYGAFSRYFSSLRRGYILGSAAA